MPRSRVFQRHCDLMRIVAGTKPRPYRGRNEGKMLAVIVMGAVMIAFLVEAMVVAFGPDEA